MNKKLLSLLACALLLVGLAGCNAKTADETTPADETAVAVPPVEAPVVTPDAAAPAVTPAQ